MPDCAVIFDMDGVLVDSYRAHLESWQIVAAHHGVAMTEEQFAHTFGQTSREIIPNLWPGRFTQDDVRVFDREKEAAYRAILARDFPAMDGAPELIRALHDAGFRLAIGSSGPAENVAAVRPYLPGGQLIQATVDGGQVRQGKPAPDIFLKAAAELLVPPARCAVIEDAPVGLEAARRAGMAAIALTGTAPREKLAAGARLVVESLRELTPAGIEALLA